MNWSVMTTKAEIWGSGPSNDPIWIYTLESDRVQVRVTNFGARLVGISAPDRRGVRSEVVLGYDTAEEYVRDATTHLGATVGRYANRIANGTFVLDGQVFHTDRNRPPNTLHGGSEGFDRKTWKGVRNVSGVTFTLLSPDGDMGFPGAVRVSVQYTLAENVLRLEYRAETDKATVINLTNHAYFNLGGDACTTIEGHRLFLHADHFTPVAQGMIPTGEIVPVANTPFDFTSMRAIGERIDAPSEQLKLGGGYDHNWVLQRDDQPLTEAAIVHEPVSGRVLTVATTEPGIQFYSGNNLTGAFTGRHQIPYTRRRALCLETQHFPDSPNHPNFPSTTLRNGQVFRSSTTYTFSTR